MKWPSEIRDRNIEYTGLFVTRLQQRLARQLHENVVERYSDHLTRQPDESLDRLLHFFGSWPFEGKLALLRDSDATGSFHLIRLLSCTGRFEAVKSDGPYKTEVEGFIEIFRRRVEDLGGLATAEVPS